MNPAKVCETMGVKLGVSWMQDLAKTPQLLEV
jgi:hypothetical protein